MDEDWQDREHWRLRCEKQETTQNFAYYIYIKEKLIIDCYEFIIKYRSLKNNRERLFELNVSGEILPLSIVIFEKFEKKNGKIVVFANVSKTTLRT